MVRERGETAEHTRPAPQINWDQPAEAIHNWIRGNDKVPGAWTEACGQVCPCVAGTGCAPCVSPGCTAIRMWLK